MYKPQPEADPTNGGTQFQFQTVRQNYRLSRGCRQMSIPSFSALFRSGARNTIAQTTKCREKNVPAASHADFAPNTSVRQQVCSSARVSRQFLQPAERAFCQ